MSKSEIFDINYRDEYVLKKHNRFQILSTFFFEFLLFLFDFKYREFRISCLKFYIQKENIKDLKDLKIMIILIIRR